jgi:hypothetical protein
MFTPLIQEMQKLEIDGVDIILDGGTAGSCFRRQLRIT